MASEKKTNFWQILGVLLLIGGGLGIAWEKGYFSSKPEPAPTTQTR